MRPMLFLPGKDPWRAVAVLRCSLRLPVSINLWGQRVGEPQLWV